MKTQTFDKIFFGFIFWSILPISLFLVGWWGTIGRVLEKHIIFYAVGGLFVGIIINFFFMKKLISNLFELQGSTLAIIYIFYSIFVFGFFMGVPVFNLLLGIPAAYYTARRCVFLRKDYIFAERAIRQTTVFTTIIIFLLSVISATIALFDPFTGKNLKGMFNLDFEPSRIILLIISAIGGALLMTIQHFITRFTGKLVYNHSHKTETTD